MLPDNELHMHMIYETIDREMRSMLSTHPVRRTVCSKCGCVGNCFVFCNLLEFTQTTECECCFAERRCREMQLLSDMSTLHCMTMSTPHENDRYRARQRRKNMRICSLIWTALHWHH